MSRLDKMRNLINDAIRIKPNTKEILKELLGKAIPLTEYYDNRDIAKAMLDDAIDEGLSANDIHVAIKEIIKSDKCNNMLHQVNLLAAVQMASERYADAVEDICFNK